MRPIAHPDSLAAQDRNRPFLVRNGAPLRRYFDGRPTLPVLPVTLLQLDLLSAQRAPEPQTVRDVVLSDLGAVLQLFRTSAAAASHADRDANRVLGLVARFGPRKLRLELASKDRPFASRTDLAIAALWQRARLTAEIARLLSLRFSDIDPGQAYLSGLMHEVGRVPSVVSWPAEGMDLSDVAAIGRQLVHEWRLPSFVAPTLLFAAGAMQTQSPLQRVVSAAYDLANAVTHGLPVPRRTLRAPCTCEASDGAVRAASHELRPIRIQ